MMMSGAVGTRQRQLTATPPAGAPVASQEKMSICTFVATVLGGVAISVCVAVM